MMATGHFRSGILLTPITARLIREWIMEQRESVGWDRFSPLRFSIELSCWYSLADSIGIRSRLHRLRALPVHGMEILPAQQMLSSLD